jgi:TetR/AcrR family transcriptional regulator, tetracycline repressor protein
MLSSGMADAETATGVADTRRPPLTRERILQEALRLVDEEGLQALTMRALGTRLGVEAASLYNHVPGKRALYEGLSELLWAELERASGPDEDWRRSLRVVVEQIRRLAHEHPHAYPLLLTSKVSPVPGLRLFAAQLRVLQAAGFDQSQAAAILRAALAYALGYADMELSSLSIAAGDGDEDAQFEALLALGRTLPAELPPDLARAARVVCLADLDQQFEFGLEALLAGLEA